MNDFRKIEFGPTRWPRFGIELFKILCLVELDTLYEVKKREAERKVPGYKKKVHPEEEEIENWKDRLSDPKKFKKVFRAFKSLAANSTTCEEDAELYITE